MIQLFTTDNVPDIISKNPAETTFVFSPGMYQNLQIIPKSGQKFLASPGVLLDGGKTIQSAFNPWGVMPVDVTIQGFKIQNYASQPEQGAIGDQYPSCKWYIENCEICFNDAKGINLNSGSTVTDCKIHGNGRLGISGGGGNLRIERNFIEQNNTANFDLSGAAGGIKLAQAQLSLIRNNVVRKNNGAGIWFDVDCIGCDTIQNLVEDNVTGISYEVSWGGHCYRNVCHRNKLGDIINSTTVGLLVEENEMDMPVQIWNYNTTQGVYGWHSNNGLVQKNNWINGVLVP